MMRKFILRVIFPVENRFRRINGSFTGTYTYTSRKIIQMHSIIVDNANCWIFVLMMLMCFKVGLFHLVFVRKSSYDKHKNCVKSKGTGVLGPVMQLNQHKKSAI